MGAGGEQGDGDWVAEDEIELDEDDEIEFEEEVSCARAASGRRETKPPKSCWMRCAACADFPTLNRSDRMRRA